MRIAVFTDFIREDKTTWAGREWFLYETLKRMVRDHPDHNWFLVSPAGKGPGWSGFEGVSLLPLRAAGKSSLSMMRRLRLDVPGAVKKNRVDLMLSMTGGLSPRTRIPGCLFWEDAWLAADPSQVPGGPAPYLARNFKEYLGMADSVAVTSRYARESLMTRFGVPEEKLITVGRGVHESFQALGWEQREEVKKEYTDGREYFIHVGTLYREGGIINLLKAFSVLKKRLRSNIMLVLAGELHPAYKEFPELLGSYHFRDDVKWIRPGQNQPGISRLVAAAYALVCPSPGEGLFSYVPEALKCRVPILTTSGPAMEEAAGEAAVYFSPSLPNDFGDQFCQIYKDETLRASLIAHTDAQAEKFSWDRSAELLWSAMTRASKAKK